MTTTRVFSRWSRAPGVHRSSLIAHRSPFIARRSGVTLIEILVVVGIIGLLVAVVGLVGHTVKEKGKRESTRGIMDAVLAAVDEYRAATGRWPEPPNEEWRTDWNQPPPAPTPCDIPYEPSDQTHNPAAADDYYMTVCSSGRHFFEGPPDPDGVDVPNHTIRTTEGLWVYLQFPYVFNGNNPVRMNSEAKGNIAALLARVPETAKSGKHAVATPPVRVRPMHNLTNDVFVDRLEILDAWGRPMRYRYYVYRNNDRPFLWSAGPDGKFAADANRTENDPNAKDDIFSDRKD